MDTQKLIGEVAARHGIRLESDDPAFVLVTLAELMLQEAQAQFTAAAARSTAQYVDAAERVQERFGAALAATVRAAAREINSGIGLHSAVDGTRPTAERRWDRFGVGLLAGLALFAAGVVLGRMLP